MSLIPLPTEAPAPQDLIESNPAGWDGVGKDLPGNGKTIAIAIVACIGVLVFVIYFIFKCTNWRPCCAPKSRKEEATPSSTAIPEASQTSDARRNKVREPDLEMGIIPPAKVKDRHSSSSTSERRGSYGNFPEPGQYAHVFGPKENPSANKEAVNPYSPYPSATHDPTNPYYQSPYPPASTQPPNHNVFTRKPVPRPSAEYVERNKALVQERLRSSRVAQLDTSVAGKGRDKPLPKTPVTKTPVIRTVSPVSDRGVRGIARAVSPLGDEFEEISLEDGTVSPRTEKLREYWQ